MSAETIFTKDNLLFYLTELAKEYRKLSGEKMKAEIILVGGAAVMANYGFREMTTDIDAVILASDAMKEAVARVRDRYHLSDDWINADFRQTSSYSDQLSLCSEHLCTRSNMVDIRTVRGAYLIAMKLVSGRRYKKDLSDIVGVLKEHASSGSPITFDMIDQAMIKLYGSWDGVDDYCKQLLETALKSDNLDELFETLMAEEKKAKETILNIDREYPDLLNSDNINDIIEQALKKM